MLAAGTSVKQLAGPLRSLPRRLNVMADELDLSTTTQGSCAVVSVAGEVDLGTAGELAAAAEAALRKIGPSLVLDLHDVTFMDSSGLKVLLAVHKRAELAGGRLVLAHASSAVVRIVKITGIDKTLVLCDDVDAALATCRSGTADPTVPIQLTRVPTSPTPI